MRVNIDILSGAGRKTAAAILVTYQASHESRELRFLLDAGGALEVGEVNGWTQPENLDAILISHDHQDHMGGLIDIDDNVPVYATKEVQKSLPKHLNLQTLPVAGRTLIEGIEVTTGSAGHSFGGVWLHLNMGKGVYYSGDFSLESTLYPFMMPPKADIALLDASYGLYNNSLDQGKQSLLTFLKEDKPLVMPVPQSGRALEIACWLTSLDFHDWTLGEDCLSPETALVAPIEGICIESRPVLESIKGRHFDLNAKVILCGDPDGVSGIAADLLLQPEVYLPVYTGHLPEHARQAVSEDKAHFVRWNVHPRIRDLKTLVDHLKCDVCIPLFHGIKNENEWKEVLGSSVTSQTKVEKIYETH